MKLDSTWAEGCQQSIDPPHPRIEYGAGSALSPRNGGEGLDEGEYFLLEIVQGFGMGVEGSRKSDPREAIFGLRILIYGCH